MKRNILVVLAILAAIGWAGSASASITILPNDNSSPQAVDAVTAFDVNGSQMAGIQVTFTYLDSTTNTTTTTTVPWVADPGNGGHAAIVFGPGNNQISLTQSNDTFLNPWNATVTNNATGKSLLDIKIDGFPGNTVFDRSTFGSPPVSDPRVNNGQENSASNGGVDLTPFFGTAGSFRGLDSFQVNTLGLAVNAQYSGPVQLDAAAAVGDIFRFLDLDFTGGNQHAGLQPTDSFNFEADTDNVRAVPIPPSALLLGSGLLGLAGFGWRKRS